jgi:hypothetical protein
MDERFFNSISLGNGYHGASGFLENSIRKALTIHLAPLWQIVKRQETVTAEYESE